MPWCAQIQTDISQLGQSLQEVWRNPSLLTGEDGMGLHGWRLEVAKVVRQREQHHWWRCVQERSTLHIYSQLKQSAAHLSLEAYLSAPHGGWNDLGLVGRRALTRLRCGHHDLRIITGGWEGLEAQERLCPLCAAAVETEQHHLLDCSYFDDSRTALYDAISKMVTEAGADDDEPVAFSMQQLSRDAQWRLLTGRSHGSVKGEPLQQRVTARILATIGAWSVERKHRLVKVAEAMRG